MSDLETKVRGASANKHEYDKHCKDRNAEQFKRRALELNKQNKRVLPRIIGIKGQIARLTVSKNKGFLLRKDKYPPKHGFLREFGESRSNIIRKSVKDDY